MSRVILLLFCWVFINEVAVAQSHLKPVDGRPGTSWGEAWRRLAQHDKVPKGKFLAAVLVVEHSEAPFFIKVHEDEAGCWIYTSAYKLPNPLDGTAQGDLVQQTFKIDKKLAQMIHKRWLSHAYQVRYEKSKGVPPSDGTQCIIMTVDYVEGGLLMGEFWLPQSEAYFQWLYDLANLLKKAAMNQSWVFDGKDQLPTAEALLFKANPDNKKSR